MDSMRSQKEEVRRKNLNLKVQNPNLATLNSAFLLLTSLCWIRST
jgi:hypothetical protein